MEHSLINHSRRTSFLPTRLSELFLERLPVSANPPAQPNLAVDRFGEETNRNLDAARVPAAQKLGRINRDWPRQVVG